MKHMVQAVKETADAKMEPFVTMSVEHVHVPEGGEECSARNPAPKDSMGSTVRGSVAVRMAQGVTLSVVTASAQLAGLVRVRERKNYPSAIYVYRKRYNDQW